MSSFAISYSSSFSLSSAYYQPSRRCFILRNCHSRLTSCFEFRRLQLGEKSRRRTCLRCNCCTKGPGGTGSGENENRSVLDAFFLGKALAEVINERIESTVGEVLGTIGRFQAEQQKQVQEIQEEVFERAKKAKERAARETVESQGLVASRPATINQTPADGVVTTLTSTSIVETNTKSNENLSDVSGTSWGGVIESSNSSAEDNV